MKNITFHCVPVRNIGPLMTWAIKPKQATPNCYVGCKTFIKRTFPVHWSHYPWHQAPLGCRHGLLDVRATGWWLEADAFLIMATLRHLMAEIASDAKVISIRSSCSQPFCWFPPWTQNLRSVLLTWCRMCFSRIPA
jgi:hypothetical protein